MAQREDKPVTHKRSWFKYSPKKPPHKALLTNTKRTVVPVPMYVKDGFLARLVRALGNDLSLIQDGSGIGQDEIEIRLYAPRNKLLPVDRDPFWLTLADYTDKRIGELMSIREELQRMLNKNRKDRFAERMRTENR